MVPVLLWMITGFGNTTTSTEEQEATAAQDGWARFSVAVHVLLPVAGLALIWGQRDLFNKLLLQLDRSCVSVFCPSFSNRERLLKWAGSRLPQTWSSQNRTLAGGVGELWRDGSLLCTLINSAVPGACPNPHRHWKKPPVHAQALAYKYLGLIPIFTEDDLSASLSINLERNFIQYLQELQQAINKWQADEPGRNFSSQYVARGMGLYTGEQHRRTIFYIYANDTGKKRDNVLMYIRGPYGTQGKATIHPFHSLATTTTPAVNVLQDQLETAEIVPLKNVGEPKSFLKTISLDFSALISGEIKNDASHIPIEVDMEIDRARITYIPKNNGMYEISLVCDGEMLRGCPYHVHVTNNTSGKTDKLHEESERHDEKVTFAKKKIISKIIDCIDETLIVDGSGENNSKQSVGSGGGGGGGGGSGDDLIIISLIEKDNANFNADINSNLRDINRESCAENKHNLMLNRTDNDKANKHKVYEEVKEITRGFQLKLIETKQWSDHKINSQHKITENTDEFDEESVNAMPENISNTNLIHTSSDRSLTTNVPSNFMSKFNPNLIESTKNLKNIVNTTNKEEMLGRNEFPASIRPFSPAEELIATSIPTQIMPKLPAPDRTKSSPNFINHTSPICSYQIAPEVERRTFRQFTVEEKRRIFARPSTIVSSCRGENTSFSSSENGEGSSLSTFRDLSVLHVLDSLKQMPSDDSDAEFHSTASLPNMAGLEYFDDNTFKTRLDYWEKKSSCSSSSASLIHFDLSRDKTVIVSNKNLFSRSSDDIHQKRILKSTIGHLEGEKQKKSLDSVPSMRNSSFSFHRRSKKCKIIDNSLENCSVLSIDERKKNLLKAYYEKERNAPKTHNLEKTAEGENGKYEFLESISEKIKKFDKHQNYDSDCDPQREIVERKMSSKEILKSQFKRAIRYFKNLEENSMKAKTKKFARRLSLDNQNNNNLPPAKGGSLKLNKITQKYSINNLYDDVMGRKTGSFKGAPNRDAVAKALASFPKQENANYKQQDDSIQYNLFVEKSKSGKRKSIKSLFDVNY